MNKVFKKRQLSFLLKLGLFTLLIAGTHIYLYQYLFSGLHLFFSLWAIYAFHFIMVLLIYTVINYKYSNGETMVFNLFMGGTFDKNDFSQFCFCFPMLLCRIWKVNDQMSSIFLYHIFIFLAFEVYSITLLHE